MQFGHKQFTRNILGLAYIYFYTNPLTMFILNFESILPVLFYPNEYGRTKVRRKARSSRKFYHNHFAYVFFNDLFIPSLTEDLLVAAKSSPFKELSILDRLLTPLVFITMVVGVVLGEFAPSVRNALNTAKFDGVSIRAQIP